MGKGVPCGGDAIGRQLDDKGRVLALEELFLKQQPGENAQQDAQAIQGKDHQPSALGKERPGDQPVDRQLGGTAHKRHQ